MKFTLNYGIDDGWYIDKLKRNLLFRQGGCHSLIRCFKARISKKIVKRSIVGLPDPGQ